MFDLEEPVLNDSAISIFYQYLDHTCRAYKYCNLIGHKQETKQLRTTCKFLEPLVIQILLSDWPCACLVARPLGYDLKWLDTVHDVSM